MKKGKLWGVIVIVALVLFVGVGAGTGALKAYGEKMREWWDDIRYRDAPTPEDDTGHLHNGEIIPGYQAVQ